MTELTLNQLSERARTIRERYHQLEVLHQGGPWTIEEDALAFLTDAALVGRLTMAQQGRWPKGSEAHAELAHKLGESIWWLAVLADRMNLPLDESVNNFLTKTEKLLEI